VPLSAPKARLQTALLYLITPATPPAGPLSEFLSRVLEAGVDMVQLREKQMEDLPLFEAAETVCDRTTEFGALFIVNDRIDIALASGADGVHLGQNDLPVEEARRQTEWQMERLGGALIGLSTHTRAQIDTSDAPSNFLGIESSGADYIGVGPIHATPTKPGRPPVGYDLVTYAAQSSPLPFFAIGGIDLTNIDAVIEAGARRVSVLRALTEAEDPAAVARQLKKALESAQ
jgi:thiamine-phosphate pyrophosphorylase